MNNIEIPNALPSWIKQHIETYIRDGEEGHLWDSNIGGGDTGILTTLLLATTGRKSGNKLVIPLIYRSVGDNAYCVIASKGGAAAHPAWFLNLEATPIVELKVANDEFNAVGRVAVGEERDTLWALMSEYFPPYTEYQSNTQREIPVVVFDVQPCDKV